MVKRDRLMGQRSKYMINMRYDAVRMLRNRDDPAVATCLAVEVACRRDYVLLVAHALPIGHGA